MPITLKLLQIQENDDSVTIYCGLTFSGNYTQFSGGVGGDTLDFTTIAGVGTANGRIFAPVTGVLYGTITGINGYVFGFQPGNLLNNNIVTLWTTATTQASNGAYPAGVTGDLFIVGEFCFSKFF